MHDDINAVHESSFVVSKFRGLVCTKPSVPEKKVVFGLSVSKHLKNKNKLITAFI